MRTIPTAAAAPSAAAPSSPSLASPPSVSAPALARPAAHPAAAIMDDSTTAGVLHSAWSGDPLVLVPSAPGSGKTQLVALLAAMLASRASLRIGIAAQTRDQAAEIARRLGALDCAARLAWPKGHPAPDLGNGKAIVAHGTPLRYPNTGGGVAVATTAKWLYTDPKTLACDLLIIDEAWQATYADIGALGAFAPQLVAVGDPAQIPPIVTGETRRWADSPTGPHLPAPVALLAAHRNAASVVTLSRTWRLGPATTALVQPTFYPDLPFTSRRPPEHLATPDGDPLPEISTQTVTTTAGPSDPALVHACSDAARRLLTGTLTTLDGTRPVTDRDLAIVTPHVSQAAAIRALLSDLPHVLVGTANQLQGMERPAAVVLHPLAGYRDPTAFATDLGRACVMLSRHRAHLHVVTDTTTPDVLRAATPDPATATHRALIHRLLDQ